MKALSLDSNVGKRLRTGQQSPQRLCRSPAITVIITLLLLMVGGKSFAQVQLEEQMQLEEVIVTARKRAEALQETPLSITVFNAKQIEALSASDLSSLGSFTPNMNLAFSQGNSGGSNLGATIRGVGQFDFLISTDPGVGIYLDGVYLGRTTGAVLDLLDIGRIEVLRGPQGTLFGKNTIGGAINIISKEPSDQFEGQAKLTLGRFNRVDGQLLVSGPIVKDKLLGRLAIASNNRNGYVERTIDGQDLGDVGRLIARGALLWRASDTLTVNLAVDHTRQRQSSAPSLLAEVNSVSSSILPLWNALVGSPQTITPADVDLTNEFYQTQQTGPNQNDLDVTGLALTMEWEFEDLTVKSITGYRDLKAKFGRDGDNTPAQYVHTQNTVNQDQVSEEIQLFGSAFEKRLDWLTGFYYYNENATDDNTVRLASGLYTALEAIPVQLSGAPCAPPWLAPGCPGNPINVALDLDLHPVTRQGVTSYAVFGNFNYHLNDTVTANAGIRWTDEEKDFSPFNTHVNAGVDILPPGTKVNASWKEYSYRFGLDYQPNDDWLFFSSYSRGFKSGGFNGRPTTLGAVESYNPEFINSIEIGFKADLLGNRLRLNTTYFYNDYTDMQLLIRSLDPATGSFLSILSNAAAATIQGVELESTALVSDRLTLALGLGYLDAQYDDTGSAIGITKDSKLLHTPKWNVNAMAQYIVPLGNSGEVALRADYGYTSSYFQDAVNAASLKEDGYVLLNLRATYLPANSRYEVALFVTNLLDEKYIVSGGSALVSFGTAEYTPGRPQEWGISLKYLF